MRLRLLLLASAGSLLAACQTPPPAEPVVALTETAEPAPVDAPVAVTDRPSEGLTENDWGGEVPQSKPSGDVSEGGLGDID